MVEYARHSRFKIGIAGFSYVELLVSVAIMALLATVAMPLAETTMQRQKETELRLALRQIRQGIDAYRQAVASGKIATVPGDSGYPPSLIELASGVDDMTHPGTRLYFLRRVPRDPFVSDMAISAVDTWGKRSFASSAENPQPGKDVYDVYSLAVGNGLNGLAYRDW
ncbi:type II secretion system GspH family protein [Undibacterium sp. Jales W-56]|uniref:type II secretion system protein n=1 Tax=Undibacterium sp. Jales W-56 TaxID=2897325 RepID=UPI0021D0AFA9|nr:type II secretion system protein [Undibacterium sp. Jales W-56]MCU6433682.1 type II secretion system GspH family protein [Undibacterium sp. Jales W-56]